MIKIKKNINNIHDWCFVSGRVNALENNLFSDQFFEKLLDIDTLDNISKYFLDSKLKGYFANKESINEYESLIDAYFCDNVNEIRDLSPDPVVCDLFLLKYKLRDLKNYLKNKLIGLPREPVTFCILKSSDLECFWREIAEALDIRVNADCFPSQTESDISGALRNGVSNLKKVLRENREVLKNNLLFVVDLVIDNAYLCYVEKMYKYFSVEYAKEYFKKFIFINVIASLQRAVTAGCSNNEFLEKHYLQGFLYSACYLNLIKLPINEWKEILMGELPVDLADSIISNGVKQRNEETQTRYEIQFDNYLLDVIKPVKHVAFGPERVFGYLCGLEAEIYNIKLLIGGKINKIDNQSLKDRMRNTYV